MIQHKQQHPNTSGPDGDNQGGDNSNGPLVANGSKEIAPVTATGSFTTVQVQVPLAIAI